MENLLISACLLGVPCRYDGKEGKKVDLSLLKGKYNLIPVCPEVCGGLPTPRTPSERVGEKVLMKDGSDVTENYLRGAEIAYSLCKQYNCKIAILKERSPSCGSGEIYDGTFTKTLKKGDGITAEYLKARGIKVFGESGINLLLTNE